METERKVLLLVALLRECQPYVCYFLDKAENYGKAQILNDKINAALTHD